jgi:3'-phosphoadenosine 5'-phosphosulfate sulfotransferase (PAPS reductase)/FAD synthetase
MPSIHEVNLHDYTGVLVNSSGGKDSQTLLRQVVLLAQRQGYPLDQIEVAHQDLGHLEWEGVKELAQEQAEHYGLRFSVTRRRDASGAEGSTILDYARERKMWPSRGQRWCTSEFKRGPGLRVLTAMDKRLKGNQASRRYLYCLGFRAQESPARKALPVLQKFKRASSKSKHIDTWLPIHDWSEEEVWTDIRASGVRAHHAYDLGMPRLSCCFCIFAPKAALMIAGKERPELLQEYVDLEKEIGHTFTHKLSLAEVQRDLQEGAEPDLVELDGAWNM